MLLFYIVFERKKCPCFPVHLKGVWISGEYYLTELKIKKQNLRFRIDAFKVKYKVVD